MSSGGNVWGGGMPGGGGGEDRVGKDQGEKS